MPTPNLARVGFLGLAKETTQGTAVTATTFVPATGIKPEDVVEYVDDDSIQASVGKVRGVYQGAKDGTFEVSGLLFPDSVGTFLAAAGMTDSTTGPAGAKSGTTAVLAVGATTATYTLVGGTAPVVNDVIQFDVAPNAECRTLTSVTGAGPYTLNWTAPLQYAHAAAATAVNVTGTAYTHTFKMNVLQPASFTLVHYNAVTTRQYPGSMLDSLDLTIDTKGALKYVSKWKTWPSSTVTKPSAVFPTTAAYMSWQGSLSIGGSANAKSFSGKFNLKREAEAIHTFQGTQNPYNVFSGPFSVDSGWKFIMLDEVDWLHIINNDQPSLVLTVTPPSSGPVLTITGTVGAWKKAPVDVSTKYTTIGEVAITHATNSTDGGPLAATLVNSVVTGY